MTVVLDSSGWVELLADAGRGHIFEPPLYSGTLLVPTIVRYEVGRYALAHGSLEFCQMAYSAMSKFTEVVLDRPVAESAADFAHTHKLSTTDAIIYATAQGAGAELWTQDAHFKNLPGVKFFPKP